MRDYNDTDVSDREGLSKDEACRVAGIGMTMLCKLLRSGAVPARKAGRRTIILRSDLMAWLDALPRLEPKAA